MKAIGWLGGWESIPLWVVSVVNTSTMSIADYPSGVSLGPNQQTFLHLQKSL